ncbi:protein timeless isoform X2 [Diorhabda carinulata]|uniref:protein timeless isoform X2 n=1 Tax=Diorhabda carinulata TaxID=1163345 RepID=UPI0025A29DE7|nr:protein timeless isoform X2 [Diorhabda carinulata]
MANYNPIHNTFSSLLVQSGDDVSVNEDCLEEISRKLDAEDSTLRTFRRAIGFGENIKKNLMPLLLLVKDDSKISDASKIIDTTIKILVNLTIPVEYLLSHEAMSSTDVGNHTMFELKKLLTSSKEVFTEIKNTKAVVDHMKFIVESDSQLDLEQCDNINNCLLLLRNILHIPEYKSPPSSGFCYTSMQNQIMWNLFTQSIDKIIIFLISSSQKGYWGVTLVQLIALMYKDQHVGTLQKLLNLWLEASYSDSSEDNESNTSPPDQGSDDSSPVITSDPTSDSSDNGGNYRNKSTNNSNNNISSRAIIERTKSNPTEAVRSAQNRTKSLNAMKRNKSTETETSTSSGVSSMGHSMESNDIVISAIPLHLSGQNFSKRSTSICQSNQSEISDCGYVTQVENQESISTSSNEDDQPTHQKPVHQKPPTFQKTRYHTNKSRSTTTLDKKELRRKKLVKRRKTNIINMKGLIHHLPTDEDIANILKEFTVDFLLKGYGTLVNNLYTELLSNVHIHIDTSHFFWLVTYFLKFAVQLEIDPEHISPVLSYDILSYLVFQGICICEELEISCATPNLDLRPCLRRLHLVVTAIREFLQGVEAYQKMIHLSDTDKDNLGKLQSQIVKVQDLKMLFVLLLRRYNVNMQSKQYLQDLILTNHNFCLFLDNSCTTQEHHSNMAEHLKNFGTVEIMRQYGLLLENFKENGEFINNCIFTMMHHIGGDLNNIETLFQPSILKTFSQIWETDYELCDDWSDLIEYVIHKFINISGTHCIDNNPSSIDFNGNLATKTNEKVPECRPLDEILMLFRWTKEEKDNLLKYYNQSKESSNAIAGITQRYEESGFKIKSQMSIIEELLEQNIISENEYENLLKERRIERRNSFADVKRMRRIVEDIPIHKGNLIVSDTEAIKDYLHKENKGKFLDWLQDVLLEACYVKLLLGNPEQFKETHHLLEPIVYYFTMLNLPIPLVPWTVDQGNILKYQPFVLLLHKLGFYLPVDTGKIFVRIPNFWTADHMFSIAQQLGPVDKDKIKFDVNTLKGLTKCNGYEIKPNLTPSLLDTGRYSVPDFKLTPSVVRYTPLPNTSEWFQNVLKVKLTATIPDSFEHIASIGQLSIAIPDNEIISCNIPTPELSLANRAINSLKTTTIDMDFLANYDNDLLSGDEIERNTNCDTPSVASDLMCVSDEDDKVILILKQSDKIA